MTARYCEVAVPVPVRRTFTYRVPVGLAGEVVEGVRVRVPFGPRTVTATVVAEDASPAKDLASIRDVTAVLGDAPAPTAEVLRLTRFVARYYMCSWGDAIEAALPSVPKGRARERTVRRLSAGDPDLQPARAVARRRTLEKIPADGRPVPVASLDAADRRCLPALARAGCVAIDEARAPGPPSASVGQGEARVHEPTDEQAAALDALVPAVDEGAYRPFLLFGATGSGKTEVYLRAAEAALARGRTVLYLVPEIGLTPLLLARVRSRFGDRVAVLHSGLGPRARLREWRRVRDGEATVVIGARSAVFAPLGNVGLIVVDEEHDASYKQDETPRYNGRDLAIVRAKDADAVVVLGSATPSLESFRHARAGRYELVRMAARVAGRPLPDVGIVDMREEYGRAGTVVALSEPLATCLREAIDRGEQALVLRNRRGWSAAILCPRCGNRAQCDHCSVTLTWHFRERRMRCHACGFARGRPAACPFCGHEELKEIGEGTERIEDDIRAAVPGARVARMDRDTVRRRGAHEALLARFDRGEIDVLVGTQMIAKGHDFHGVTLVGVVAADHALGLPDFRAGERAFQLLTQVAGRAGRGELGGRVLLQAFDPEHAVLRDAVAQDYERFYDREIEFRRAMRYPPLSSLVKLVVSGKDLGKVVGWAADLGDALRERAGDRLLVAGPGPAPVERVKDRFRYQLLARSAGRARLLEAVEAAVDATATGRPHGALTIDVDPYSLS